MSYLLSLLFSFFCKYNIAYLLMTCKGTFFQKRVHFFEKGYIFSKNFIKKLANLKYRFKNAALASYFLQIICINAYGNHSSTHYNPVYYFFRSIHFFTFLSKKGCAKFCASPMLLDFFRLAAYNQIRSNQGYTSVGGCLSEII